MAFRNATLFSDPDLPNFLSESPIILNARIFISSLPGQHNFKMAFRNDYMHAFSGFPLEKFVHQVYIEWTDELQSAQDNDAYLMSTYKDFCHYHYQKKLHFSKTQNQ